MTSATTVDLCISWRTPIINQSRTDFTIQKMECKLLLCKGRHIYGYDYCLFLECNAKPDRPFDVSVHVIVGSDVVSQCRTTFRSARDRIWKGDCSEMSKVAPDYYKRELLFKIFVYDSTESGPSQRTTAEKFLLRHASENTLLGVDSLLRDQEKLLEQEDSTADVQLRCDGHEFKAHKFFLSSRSEVFASMLRSDMLEGKTGRVEIRDTEADIFAHFLLYLYTLKLPKLTPETVVQLYETGDRYRVEALKAQCRLFLVQNLAPHNVCDVLLLADRHSDPDLKESIISYMMDHKIPLQKDVWQPFCTNHLALAVETLNRFYELQSSSK